jgi:23S rRNA pseudouridine2605 synthase
MADNPSASAFPMRLQAFLARSGVASRRACEELITAGRVSVDGSVVTILGSKVDAGADVRLDGRPVALEVRRHYLALNKPPGYLCSSSDPQGRPLALELLPVSIEERLYNVGRLDFRSSGLILFTNDGDFAARIGHPSAEIEKEYLVDSTVPIPDAMIDDFAAGVEVEGVLYKARSIERLGQNSVRVVLIEGKNREIRRVFSHYHLHPEKLTRLRIGPVRLGALQEGSCRPLSGAELSALRADRQGAK